MAKKKIKIEIGKFYMSYGGTSHPSFVYEKTSHGTYLSIRFGTTRGRHMSEIKPIQEGYDISYVCNRPFEGTREDYGNKELLGLQISADNYELLESIKCKPPRRTQRASKRYK